MKGCAFLPGGSHNPKLIPLPRLRHLQVGRPGPRPEICRHHQRRHTPSPWFRFSPGGPGNRSLSHEGPQMGGSCWCFFFGGGPFVFWGGVSDFPLESKKRSSLKRIHPIMPMTWFQSSLHQVQVVCSQACYCWLNNWHFPWLKNWHFSWCPLV